MKSTVKWVVRLEKVDASGRVLGISEIGSIVREIEYPAATDFGLRLAEGKVILEQLQLRMTQQQVNAAAAMNRCCAGLYREDQSTTTSRARSVRCSAKSWSNSHSCGTATARASGRSPVTQIVFYRRARPRNWTMLWRSSAPVIRSVRLHAYSVCFFLRAASPAIRRFENGLASCRSDRSAKWQDAIPYEPGCTASEIPNLSQGLRLTSV